MMKRLLIALVFTLIFFAQNTTAASEGEKLIKDTPASRADLTTQISIAHEGTDSLGARLATRLKERFNQSSLFKLNTAEDREKPELRIIINTKPEFDNRPSIGSIYGIAWVSSQKGYLSYLLGREIGTVDAEGIDSLVDKLVERTDGIAAKYAYLWR